VTLGSLCFLLAAGVVAGVVTTVASLGGGVLVVALLGMTAPMATVLGISAPALMIGNLSRAIMLRRAIDWPMAARFSAAAVPAALLASLTAAAMPGDLLELLVAGFLLAFCAHEALAKPRDEVPASPHASWLALAAGAVTGAVSGLTGVAGFVASPLLLRLGLAPLSLVATSATCMAAVHLAKGVGFSLAAVLTPALLPGAAVLAAGIVAGNALGARLLARMPREVFRKVLVIVVGLASLQLAFSALRGCS